MDNPAEQLFARLQSLGNTAEAAFLHRYHRIDRVYLGVRLPAIRNLAREFAAKYDEATILAAAGFLWDTNTHEGRELAGKLLLSAKVKAFDQVWALLRCFSYDFDCWSLADVLMQSAAKVLKACPKYEDELEHEWLSSDNLWRRRACLTFGLFHAKKGQNPERGLRWCATLVKEKAWFSQKAVAWYLREVSKHSPQLTLAFVEAHQNELANFARREATRIIQNPPLRQKSGRKKASISTFTNLE